MRRRNTTEEQSKGLGYLIQGDLLAASNVCWAVMWSKNPGVARRSMVKNLRDIDFNPM